MADRIERDRCDDRHLALRSAACLAAHAFYAEVVINRFADATGCDLALFPQNAVSSRSVIARRILLCTSQAVL
jgi:hypothetical protein